MSKKVYILGAIRTPVGAIGGGLASLQARELATIAIKALLEKTAVDPAVVEYTCMGWVMQDPALAEPGQDRGRVRRRAEFVPCHHLP